MLPLRRRPLLNALSGVMVAVLAVGASMVIPSYVWCEGSQEMHLSCCCPDSGEESVVRAPCCETRTTSSPDNAQGNETGPRVGSAPLAVLVAALEWQQPACGVAIVSRVERVSRAGPSERLHARHSIYLI